jgi:hypothetical protein
LKWYQPKRIRNTEGKAVKKRAAENVPPRPRVVHPEFLQEAVFLVLEGRVAAAVERRKEIQRRRLEEARRTGALFQCGRCSDGECPLFEVKETFFLIRIRTGRTQNRMVFRDPTWD